MLPGETWEISKNTLVVASESLGNVFAEQMFTLQLNNIISRAILKKIAFLLSRKDALGTTFPTKIMPLSSLF